MCAIDISNCCAGNVPYYMLSVRMFGGYVVFEGIVYLLRGFLFLFASGLPGIALFRSILEPAPER